MPRGEELIARVLSVASAKLEAMRGLSGADRDDARQQTLMKVLDAVKSGHVSQLDAYTRRVAWHCAIDVARSRKRPPLRSASHEGSDEAMSLEALAGPDSERAPTPERLVAEKSRREAIEASAPELWTLVSQAPENYRTVLELRYARGLDFEQIAAAELERRLGRSPEPEIDAKEFQRALATVHAWHSRALKWLQQRASASWREAIR